MDNNIIESLMISSIFKNIDETNIKSILDKINYKIIKYSKDETIAIEEDECSSLGIIIKGKVQIQKMFLSGKIVTIDTLEKGNIFGEVIIFSNTSKYPATIMSANETTVMFIAKEEILKLCSGNMRFLNNFMNLLSNKILMLNKKVKNLSYQTIRQKITKYILEESNKQSSLIINLNVSRKDMADHLGIPRPSLSRELINMKEDNLIDFHKKTIKVIDKEKLLEVLM